MKNKYSTSKSIFAITASIVGAGFASGKEISVYFLQFGLTSILFAVIIFLLFGFGIKIILKVGQFHSNLDELNTFLYKRKSNFANFLFIFSTFIIFSAMLSGIISLCTQINLNNLSMVIFFVIGFILINGYNWIIKLNALISPILIGSIVFVCIFIIANNRVYNLPSNKNIPEIFANTILYTSTNLLTSISVILFIGGKISKKQINSISWGSAISIMLMFILIIIALNSSQQNNSNLPILTLLNRLSKNIYIFYIPIILFASITTVVSCGLSLINYYNPTFKSNIFTVIFIMAIGIIIGNLGFTNIIKYLYPIIGIIGTIQLISIWLYNKKTS